MTEQCTITVYVKTFLSIKLEILHAVIQEQTIALPHKRVGMKSGAVNLATVGIAVDVVDRSSFSWLQMFL